MATAMRDETLRYFEEIVWIREEPLNHLFNSQFTYVNPQLAKHYGLTPKGEGVEFYELDGVAERGGLLTQGSMLTMGGDDASMVTRGLFILRDVLRGSIKNPPPGLDTTPVPSSPGLSRRSIAENRVSAKACGSCHVKFEPLAFAFEKFDGTGAFSEVDEYGNVQQEDGTILIPGQSEGAPYQSIAEFMNILAQSERVRETLTRKIIQFSIGRPLSLDDHGAVKAIYDTSISNGGTYQDVLRAIAVSELTLMTRTEVYE